jgi:universal stress protein A
MTLKTILVPTDFSEPSAAALAYARQLADAFRSSIHLLHVWRDPALQPWAVEGYSASLAAMRDELKLQAQRHVEEALPAAYRRKYRARLVVASGEPFSRIVDYAKRNRVDLIVMGTHGRGAIARAILGSVTERVVRLAPCAVLAVRDQDATPRRKARATRTRRRPVGRG